jgi:hypothetical protein
MGFKEISKRFHEAFMLTMNENLYLARIQADTSGMCFYTKLITMYGIQQNHHTGYAWVVRENGEKVVIHEGRSKQW